MTVTKKINCTCIFYWKIKLCWCCIEKKKIIHSLDMQLGWILWFCLSLRTKFKIHVQCICATVTWATYSPICSLSPRICSKEESIPPSMPLKQALCWPTTFDTVSAMALKGLGGGAATCKFVVHKLCKIFHICKFFRIQLHVV